jgi:hypothetical protein
MIKKSGPLKLALHGMDNRALKTMMLFLQGPCKGAAMVVNEVADGDVDIFDAEATESKRLLEKHLLEKISRPVIVMSLREFVHEGVIHIVKPIKTTDMLFGLDQAKDLAKELSKKAATLAEPLKPENIEKDFKDFFNDELFDYISTSSWDEPPTLQGSPEKLREVRVPEKQELIKALGDQNNTQENKSITSIPPDSEARIFIKESDQQTYAVETEIQESKTNLIDQEEDKKNSDGQGTMSTDTASAQPAISEESGKEELKTFVSDLERKKTSKHETAMQLDEKGFIDYIGNFDDIDVDDPKQFSNASYNPNDYLQGFFQSALLGSREKNQAILLKSHWCPIALFPKSQEVWLDARDSELSTFAEVKLRHKTIVTKITVTPINSSPINLGYALDKFQNIDAFMWKLACWTSKGRYPQEIDYQLPVYLSSWPNFTRLLITPHALRIAALLIQGPRTMANIAQILGIKPRYVFVFISCTHAVGLAGQAKRLSDSLVEPQNIRPSKGQGLLGRIMNKLRN